MLHYKGTKAPRAAALAYTALAFAPVNDAPSAFGYQDQMPRALPRATAGAYQVSAKAVEVETASVSNGFIANNSRGALLAAPEAYTVPQRPTTQFDPGIPAASGYIDDRPRHLPRGQRNEQIQQRATWLEPGLPPGVGTIDIQPRKIPRASAEAYQTPLLHPWDNQPVAFGWITQRAPGAPRAAQQAYVVEHKSGIEGFDKPASDGHQSGYLPPAMRAALTAYTVVVPMVRDEPEIGRQFVEGTSRPATRAIAAAYAVDQSAGIALPGAPVSLGHVAQPQPALHAPSAVYLAFASLPIAELPPANGAIDTLPKRLRLAPAEAYTVPSRSMAGEVGVPAQFGFVTHMAPAAKRASSVAYVVASIATIADPPVPGSVVVPQLAPAAQRAASDAYFRQTFAEIADPMPSGAMAITGVASGPQRASASAYQMQLAPQPVEVYLPALGTISQPVFAYRANRESSQVTVIHALAEVPAATGYIEQAARAAQSAAVSAYQPPQRADIAGQSAPASTGYIEQASRHAPRAAVTAYMPVPLADSAGTEQPPTSGYVETASRAPGRAWSVAYAVPLRADIAGESAPVSYGYQEQRPIRLMRSAASVYLVAQSFALPAVTYYGTRVYVYGESSERLNVTGNVGTVHGVCGDGGERVDV